MRGVESLFTLERLADSGQGVGEATFVLKIDGEHPVFAGHFPGAPILPGVCMVYMARRAVEEVLGRAVAYATIRDCKFVKAVDPSVCSTLELRLSMGVPEEGRVRAVMTCGGEVCLKLNANVVAK